MLELTNVREVNYKVSVNSLKLLEESKNELREDGYPVESLVTLINHLIEGFNEELKIGVLFDCDINNYIEYVIERVR